MHIIILNRYLDRDLFHIIGRQLQISMRCHVFGVLKERDAKRWSHWCGSGAGSKATTGKVTVFQVSWPQGPCRARVNQATSATASILGTLLVYSPGCDQARWLLGKNLLMLGVHWILLTFSTTIPPNQLHSRVPPKSIRKT